MKFLGKSPKTIFEKRITKFLVSHNFVLCILYASFTTADHVFMCTFQNITHKWTNTSNFCGFCLKNVRKHDVKTCIYIRNRLTNICICCKPLEKLNICVYVKFFFLKHVIHKFCDTQYPKIQKVHRSCKWNLIASAGNLISIFWVSFPGPSLRVLRLFFLEKN